jgi:hypothetical protein
MPKFAPKSDARQKLAEAINELHAARQGVTDARVAEERSRECLYAARDRVSTLRAEADKPRSADALVAAIAGGEAVDILEMDKPAAEAIKAMEVAEQHVQSWRRACALAEDNVPIREAACARAEDRVKQCAAAALANAIGVDKLLAEAEEAAATILALRAKLMFVSSLLPHDSAQRAAIADFLARAWLQTEYDDRWRKNPSVKALADALAALQHDAEARIDIAP